MLQFDHLWDLHGTAVYALACLLLVDETAAVRAVTLGTADLARAAGDASTDDARRSWARHVFWRSQELVGQASTPEQLPPAMVRLGQLAQLQRACLGLCLFGGHSYGEAASLLGVAPVEVADLLSAGLRDLERSAPAETPVVA